MAEHPLAIGGASMARFIRFALAGVANTAFGYALFAALVLAGMEAGAALAVATACGVAFSYQTTKRFVFRSPGRSLRFVALYCILLAANWALLRGLHGRGMADLLAQALLAPVIAAASFLGQKHFVFDREAPAA